MATWIVLPRVDADPRATKLLGDRVLLKVEANPEMVGSIVIPETSRSNGVPGCDRYLKIGEVVAAGPGDRCGTPDYKPTEDYANTGFLSWTSYKPCVGACCPRCHGTGRLPMTVRLGDRVLYDHPSDKAFLFQGVEYVFVHEQQHVRGVLSATGWWCTWCGAEVSEPDAQNRIECSVCFTQGGTMDPAQRGGLGRNYGSGAGAPTRYQCRECGAKMETAAGLWSHCCQ